MKILYITPLVAGFEDIIRGKKESRGLPSFIYPLKKLLQTEEVNIILVSNFQEPIDIKVDWIKRENIIANVNFDFATGSWINRIVNKCKAIKSLLTIIRTELKNGGYDFVYCHGTAAVLGNILANMYHVECGYRLYGVVDLAKQIKEKGKIYAALHNIKYLLIFRLRKKFLLITDDGTHGDVVYESLAKKGRYDFFFWLNGIQKKIDYSDCMQQIPPTKYIFHAARIDRLKRQDKVIELLKILHNRGVELSLYFAGHISDKIYKEELDNLIKDNGLNNKVFFLGDITREDMQNFARNSLAVTLFGDFSNQGNVFFECGLAGGIIVTYDELPLHRFIENKKNGFLVQNIQEAADVIEYLNNCDLERLDCFKRKSEITFSERLLSWDERVEKELKLIL